LTGAAYSPYVQFMASTYEEALRIIAESYGRAIAARGGMSLARIATLVVNRGSFFNRLSHDTSFSARNLDRFAAWFRNEEHWPDRNIPEDAAAALFSIGRPPLSAAQCGEYPALVDCGRSAVLQERAA
jgi:hypothetical protein